MGQDIFNESLTELVNYLVHLEKGTNDTISKIRNNELAEANQKLILIFEGLQWAVDVLRYTKHLFEQKEIIIEEQKLLEIIAELDHAIKNDDYLLTADILEYEISELINRWSIDVKKVLLS